MIDSDGGRGTWWIRSIYYFDSVIERVRLHKKDYALKTEREEKYLDH
jgi:hypothetical protein